jgi:O-antigen/teichoic acid export membrane protein
MARRFKETHNKPVRDKELIKQMLSFISMLLVTVLAQLLKTKGIVILINLFFGLVINAAYAVAVQVSNMVNSFVINFKQSMVPQMMSAYGAGDKQAMYKIINIGTKITFLLLLMISLPVIFEGQFILDLWLKTPPDHAAKLSALVLISINISSFTYFLYQGVHATGKILGQQIWVSSAYILNILIIYLAFKLGAGFETALYVNMGIGVFQCGINIFYAKKCYDYDVAGFVRKTLFPCLISVLIIVFPLLFITHAMTPSTLRFILVFGVAEVLIVLLGYVVVLNKPERQWALSFIKGVFHRKK